MTPVLLEAPPLVRERRIAFPVVIYREVRSGHRPGRGLGLSVVLHNVVLLLIVVFSGRVAFVHSHRVVVEPPREPSQESVLYLPVLGGGNEGSGQAGGGSDDASKMSDGLRAKSRRGFAYRGPQPTVSNPPRASLGTQTILQPSIENLPLLRRDLPLPNIMNIAPPESRPEQKPLVVKSERLAIRTTPERPIEAPKITLPLDAVSSMPRLSASEPALPQKPVPRAPEVSDVHGTARPQKELLVLNAVPAPPQVSAQIPRAEARSLFAIAPAEATIIAEPAAGAETGTPSSSATGSGDRTDLSRGDALAEIASGGDVKNRAEGSGIGDGGRYGSGRGSGLNPTVVSNGTGRGASSGSGTGTGDATSLGSGAGAGSAPGGGGFPGIAIQGGQYGNNTANLHPSSNPRRQTSYNMTIVSTAASGGGLPDLGVFENEKVYTVYLDMKANDEDPAPSWILQYAVLQPQADASDPRVSSQKIVGIPTPPYVMLKAVPGLRPDLLRRSAHTLIVAFAVMNTGGKLEQISVRQSPDSELIAPLVEALAGWMFQPAEINGKPVALKILLGIRLAPNH
jgi:hypothetical protein